MIDVGGYIPCYVTNFFEVFSKIFCFVFLCVAKVLSVFLSTDIRVFVPLYCDFILCVCQSVWSIFLKVPCHFWFLDSIICLRMKLKSRFICNLGAELPAFWKFLLCLFLCLMRSRKIGSSREDWFWFSALWVASRKDFCICRLRLLISLSVGYGL